MRYQSKSSVAYLFRNFWHLMPIALAAAVFCGFSCNSLAKVDVVYAFLAGQVNADNVADYVLQSVSVLRFGKMWWCLLAGVVTLAFTESMLSIKVSCNMRTGDMPLFPLKRSLSVLPTMLLFVVSMALCLELFNLIAAGVALLLKVAGVITVVVVAFVLAFLAMMIVMFLVGNLLFAFPIMFLESYSFNLALSYSVRLTSEKRRLLWGIAVLYPLVKAALSAICGFINIYAVTVAVFSVFYLFCIVLLPVMSFKLYYDTVGGERRDIMRIMW